MAAAFPEPNNSEKPGAEPISAALALRSFELPPGFKATVFASEPQVRQPIAMTFDARGRLWVAENYTYAEAGVNFATNLADRVIILTDRDGDGQADERKVFYDQAHLLTSVELGRGGVFLLCPPRLLWVPDRNGDDLPDSEPEVVLDGFTTTTGNRHTFANGLKWGPDGWLWGRVGISSQARIGVPGTPESGRVLMNGGIWRYHPERKVVEAVSHGTTNPWGLDWNEVGEPFFINTVIGHLWHAIPGAHFQRMHGDDVNPHSYGLIGQHADHYHFDVAAGWTKSRAAFDGSSFALGSDSLGGGHAHTGLMIYQGENWPRQYRDQLFTVNFHGRRVNSDRLEREGSGYVGRHGADLFSVGDPWFRGIDLIQGPDGGAYLSDWSDTGECHDHDGVHRTSGRIYKIAYGDPQPYGFGDLAQLDFGQLKPLLFSRNEWVARHARQVIADRAVLGRDRRLMVDELKKEFGRQTTTPSRLRAIWALNAVGGTDQSWLLERIQNYTRDENDSIRSWAVRLLAAQETRTKAGKSDRVLRAFEREAERTPSALVRLYLASALQHFPVVERTGLALRLAVRGEDATDHNLPLLLWQGIEPLVSTQPEVAARLFAASRIPLLQTLIARRVAEELENAPGSFNRLLAEAVKDSSAQANLLTGLAAATKGWRKAVAPVGWASFAAVAMKHPEVEVQKRVRELGVLFGDGRALDEVRAVLTDSQAAASERRRALATLLENRAPELGPLLKQVAADTTLAAPAVVGLIQLGDPEASVLAVGKYQWVATDQRQLILNALVSRVDGARVLLNALSDGRISKTELTPFHARQISGLGDASLAKRLLEVWGSIQPPNENKRVIVARFRAQLSTEVLAGANLGRGRELFQQSCAVCHQLYGDGAHVGPDLTGSGRANLDYLLENVVDPSSVVPADYRMSIVSMKDGRVLNGIVSARTDRTLVLQGQGEPVTLERSEITNLETVSQSLMPEGLLENLPADGVRDLLAYLMHSAQVPLPAKER